MEPALEMQVPCPGLVGHAPQIPAKVVRLCREVWTGPHHRVHIEGAGPFDREVRTFEIVIVGNQPHRSRLWRHDSRSPRFKAIVSTE